MADRPDRDQLVPGPAIGSGITAGRRTAELPTSEPVGRSLHEQRADLQRLIYELDGTLKYMGTGHPQRAATEARRAQLVTMLTHVEVELGIKS